MFRGVSSFFVAKSRFFVFLWPVHIYKGEKEIIISYLRFIKTGYQEPQLTLYDMLFYQGSG